MNWLTRFWLTLKLMWLESRKTRISKRLSFHKESMPVDHTDPPPPGSKSLDDRASQRLLEEYQRVLVSIGRARYKLDNS